MRPRRIGVYAVALPWTRSRIVAHSVHDADQFCAGSSSCAAVTRAGSAMAWASGPDSMVSAIVAGSGVLAYVKLYWK